MFKELTSSLIEAITQNGPVSVFWAAIIEQVISPIPSVLIPMSAGVLLISGDLAFIQLLAQVARKISFPYAVGATIGSSVLYLASYFGGRILIERFGKFFGLSVKNVDRFRNKFTRGFKDELIIFALIALPATPISLVAASCGVIGIPAFEFYPLMLAGTFIRSLFLGWLGSQVGETYQLIGSGLNKVEALLSIVGVGAAFTFLAFLYLKRAKILKD